MANAQNTAPHLSLHTPDPHHGASNPPPNPPSTDEVEAWRKHFADDDAEKQERILKQEGEKLSKLLDAAFPGSKRDAWTRADLEAAVESSRQAYENKKRIAGGKPRNLFHTVVRQLDAHSNLFKVIPSGDKYTSLVVGAVTILIEASVSHMNTIDELSHALEFVGQLVEHCAVNVTLIKSKPIQSAIGKLYVEVFQFYANAIIWYDSSRLKKIAKALRKDFSQEFRSALETIKEKAGHVIKAAEIGTRAEVRVIGTSVDQIGTNVDRLVTDLGDSRMQSSLEYSHLVALVEQISRSLESFRSLPVPTGTPSRSPTPIPPDSPEATDHGALMAASGGSRLPSSSVSVSIIRHALSSAIDELSKPGRSRQLIQQSNLTTLTESHLAQNINYWLNSDVQLCHLEHRPAPSAANVDALVGNQIMRVIAAAHLPSIMYAQSQPPVLSSDETELHKRALCMILSISRDIFELLPEDDEQTSPIWTWLEQRQLPDQITISAALDIFATSVAAAPPNLHIIIIGYPAFLDVPEDVVKSIVESLRNATRPDVKTLIISQRRIPSLVQCLNPGETRIVMTPHGKRIPQAQIVLRRRLES